ncbi:MAG: CHC2 zinc finger domain-containing protein, partial [Segatella oris]
MIVLSFYYCFGCHASGNAIKFLMELEHLTFVEAL